MNIHFVIATKKTLSKLIELAGHRMSNRNFSNATSKQQQMPITKQILAMAVATYGSAALTVVIAKDKELSRGVISSLDMIFEGCVRANEDGDHDQSLPLIYDDRVQLASLSEIVKSHWRPDEKITFIRLYQFVSGHLQVEPFVIHDRPILQIVTERRDGGFSVFREAVTPESTDGSVRSVDSATKGSQPTERKLSRNRRRKKSLSNTTSQVNRKFTISHWTHYEVLNQEELSGGHLRIMNGDERSSWLIAPKHSESVVVADCSGSGPILLGPVRNTVFLRGLNDCTVSVIASRVVIERCEEITVHLCTPLSPVLIDSHAVKLAPYNICYDVSEHLS
ncbi:unnamed protein product [Anisakis simplex]|uniref:C-CAP/cofactor C-like domain-containing protein n=1 Tax=Anisakis simplex TaxID=6269 RepID=A0A3P6T6M5_ANISI|nr:unnamed protein product [Anisakis simplex]